LELKASFGEVVSTAGLKQLRIAETEKYAHVTYFFSGGQETEFDGEDRVLVPSPKVATYDLKPEMSAVEVTEKLEDAIRSGRYDTIVVNYANPDMVGHTGDLNAARAAIEAVDACVGRLDAALREVGGVGLVTADHGNAELMVDPETGGPHTAHTTFDVPLLVLNPEALAPGTQFSDGRLCDIAPTLLTILGLTVPDAMTGHSLLQKGTGADARTEPEVVA
jgi:2,3-bisphosphoglycerate-independent phosphoglycerate mutase